MKTFFLPMFVAALAFCCFMVVVIAVALVTRGPGEWWNALLFAVPNAVFLVWATREMFRGFRPGGRRPTRSVML